MLFKNAATFEIAACPLWATVDLSAKQIATTKISECSSRTLQDLPQLGISKAAEIHPRCSEDN